MQPSAGPATDLPHSHTRPVHWIGTATALAAVLGAAALIQPSAATATQPAAGSAASAADPASVGAPDPEKAEYPLDCGPNSVDVVKQGSADLDGDGRQETVAVVRCEAGFGTPPSGIYVLTHPASGQGAPRVAETFLDPREGMSVTDFAVRGRTVSAKLLGYSSRDVPRCCPDLQRKVKWRWSEGKFELTAAPVAGSV
ncbi:hypothetical protein ACH429_11435 [Streptomyces pathocidini]|uniref:Secreted protein n=1 Tax=Streptomyces pathocidini TaxID=1650571 RepID=A0ABW7UPZ6_9ACTN|nr:hypothetical protein [Streptomyces pathocidini]